MRWNWTSPPDQKETRVDKAVFEAIEDGKGEGEPLAQSVSRSMITNWIKRGELLVSGERVLPKTTLRAGVRVQIVGELDTPSILAPVDLPIDRRYEDEDLSVIHKPAGLVVHPAPGYSEETLVHRLLHHFPDIKRVGSEKRPGIVHRLDKDTAGLMIVAKTQRAYLKLTAMIQKKEISRIYHALCYGDFYTRTQLDTPFGRNPSDRKKMAVLKKSDRSAITHFTPLERFKGVTLIEAKLETGRTHQIRVHACHLGHSLLGDAVYGTPRANQHKFDILPNVLQEKIRELSGQLLVSKELSFEHPFNKQLISLNTPYPEKFREMLEGCRTIR